MKKGDVKDLATLEEYYSKVRKIRFDDNVQIESLDDIYHNLFTLRTHGFHQRPTFFSRGALQCASGRFRSIDDFIKLAKKYFPDKTLKEIFQYLKEKEETYQKDNLIQNLRYCGTIRKYNFSGLVPIRYAHHMGISGYRLRDLNPNLVNQTVSDILT
jgi:hypothetical protein